MSGIHLTKGQTAQVDLRDYDWLLEIGTWCFSNSGYAVHYYSDEAGRRKTHFMHRLITARALGHAIPPGLQVDHKNQDRLDNRMDNLRLATGSQNQANKGTQINNTSLYKGVTCIQGKWEPRIHYASRRLHLGRFDDPVTAAFMYDAASRFLYGEFAGCNFPLIPTSQAINSRLILLLLRYGLTS
ncbi:MAG: HNH endonuclease [Chloroflexota bacterium]